MKTNLPVFRLKECSVRRRYSDFEWLRKELERDSKVRRRRNIVFFIILRVWLFIFRLLFRHYHQKLGKNKFLHFYEAMMEYSKMNSLKNVVKVSNNLLTSKSKRFFELQQQNHCLVFRRVAGHPLAQNERSLHVFLQETTIDHDKYVPGKVRNS